MKNGQKIQMIKRTSHKTGCKEIKGDYEVPTGKSETIQDDSMSIQEMFQRLNIIKPLLEKEGVGLGDEDFDEPDYNKIHRSDINTQERIKLEMREKATGLEKVLQNARKAVKEPVKEEVKPEKIKIVPET